MWILRLLSRILSVVTKSWLNILILYPYTPYLNKDRLYFYQSDGLSNKPDHIVNVMTPFYPQPAASRPARRSLKIRQQKSHFLVHQPQQMTPKFLTTNFR